MKYIDDISNFIFLSHKPKKADIIFIPGGAYPEIAEKAAELWKEGFSDLILPSGRYSTVLGYFPGAKSKSEIYNGTYKTECDFLKDVLLKNGVSKNSILLENKATFTYENAIFSRNITDSLNLNIKTAIICCKSFHARRCLMYYQTLYPDAEFILCPAETEGITKSNWFTNEKGINTVLGEIERCGWQFKSIIKEMLKV